MKQLQIIILILHTINLSAQNCIPSAIVFSTQEQVDEFPINYPTCTIVDGSIGVTGTVENLDSLVQLAEIGGNFFINNSSVLMDISGLENLESIGGFLKIENTNNLESLAGLENLINIGDDLEFINPHFPNLQPFSSLLTIGGGLIIQNTNGIDTFNLDGLSNLTSINGDFTLNGDIQFSGFENLESISGNLNLNSLDQKTNILFSNLISIGGFFECKYSKIESINSPILDSIGGYLLIQSNIEMKSVQFNSLQVINGGLTIKSNSKFCNMNFNEVVIINGNVLFQSLNDLLYIDSLSSLKTINGDFTIESNFKLKKILSIDSLTTVNDITIKQNTVLDTISSFNTLKNMDKLIVYDADVIKLKAFQSLVSMVDFDFKNLDNLDTIRFDSLISFTGSSLIQLNDNLKHISFKKLVSINRLFVLVNPVLEQFDTGNNLTNAFTIAFRDNNLLTSITGFQNLSFCTIFELDGNPFLADISGIDSPIEFNSIEIRDNSFLSICSVQSICDHLSQGGTVVNISNNASGCNSVNEIESNCPNPTDSDGDNIPDFEDNCDFVSNPDQQDSNNDGIGDACEDIADSDGDGIANQIDNCPYDFNPNQEDSNDNGIGDVCDSTSDSDGDGVQDSFDNCPNISNPNQVDSNGNGIGDKCDTSSDTDNDGVFDNNDNCPTTSNSDQTDTNMDGIGDACEDFIDEDGDGVNDEIDNCLNYYNPYQTDENENGVGDACEILYKVGVGTDAPMSELHLSNGSLYVDNPDKGIIFKNNNNQCYLMRIIEISGVPKPSISLVPCPE
jgi:hypothetical protein